MKTDGKRPVPAPRGAPQARTMCAADGNLPPSHPISAVDRSYPGWLGLETSHRVLFDACQDGWIRPAHRTGLLLGHQSFVSEDLHTRRSIVPVRLAFDLERLPFPDARKDLERDRASSADGTELRVVRWRSPIPLYAVTRVEVSSSELKARLLVMADQFSNVSLPARDVVVSHTAAHSLVTADSEVHETGSVQLPEKLNAVQGAMAMAVWAVPRVEPWIEVLRRGLNQDSTGVERKIGCLRASWFGTYIVPATKRKGSFTSISYALVLRAKILLQPGVCCCGAFPAWVCCGGLFAVFRLSRQ